MKTVNKIIKEIYEETFLMCKSQYYNSDEILGQPTRDIYQNAVLKVVKWFKNRTGPELEKKKNEKYIKNAIYQNFKREISNLIEKQEIRDKNIDNVKQIVHPEKINKTDTEIDEIINKLGNKTRAFVKLRMKGNTVREVKKKMDIDSMRQYYKIRDRVQTVLKNYGLENE